MEVKLVLNTETAAGSAPGTEFVPDGWPARGISPSGTNGTVSPMQLLLISFAGCSGLTVNSFLHNFGRTVSGMEVVASGETNQKPPKSFSSIMLTFKVTSADATEDDITTAIGLAKKKYCPVWATLSRNIEVETEFELSRP